MFFSLVCGHSTETLLPPSIGSPPCAWIDWSWVVVA
jgi:hypothetical protein